MDESVEIPSYLEVIITKEDCAVIGLDGTLYDQQVYLKNAVTVPREEIDPEFDFNIDPYKVFEAYMRREKKTIGKIWVPYVNIRLQYDYFEPPEDIREYLNLD